MITSNEEKLGKALKYLTTNWRADPEFRLVIEAVLKTLNAGNDKDRVNAQFLLDYLNYPGSDDAQVSANLLHMALQEGPARSAAGLPQKRRGPKKSPDDVKLEDKLMQVLIHHELGRAKDFDVEAALLKHMGSDPVEATQRAFLEKLKPRVKDWAKFFRHMQSSLSDEKPL